MDSSGNEASATPVGGVSYTAGKDAGSAVFLNGSDAYITTPILWDYEIPGFTISAWITLSEITSMKEHMIMGNCSDYVSFNGFWAEYYKDIGHRFVHLSDVFTDIITCVPDTWYHVVYVYDSSRPFGEEFNFYLDGSIMVTSYLYYTPTGASDLFIGAVGSAYADGMTGTENTLFHGAIDQLMIWDRPLSETEVIELYNTQAPK